MKAHTFNEVISALKALDLSQDSLSLRKASSFCLAI